MPPSPTLEPNQIGREVRFPPETMPQSPQLSGDGQDCDAESANTDLGLESQVNQSAVN